MMSHHCLPSQKIALEPPSEINQPFLLQDELQNQSQGPPAHRLRYPKDPPKCAFQVPRLKRPMITLRGPGPAKALPGKLPEKTGGNAIHLSTPWKIKLEPQNGHLENDFSLSIGWFFGSIIILINFEGCTCIGNASPDSQEIWVNDGGNDG